MFLLPIEEHHPTRNRAYTVWVLLAVNLAVFIAGELWASPDYLQTYGFVTTRPSATTVLTSMFLHANIFHLVGNMWFLYMFGDNVEDMMGSVKFPVAYLLAGLAAIYAHTVTTHHPEVPLVGASGAVSGVVGMYLLLYPRASFHTHVILGPWRVTGVRSTALVATGAWFGVQLLFASISSVVGVPVMGTAFWAHVGGFITGIALGFVFGRMAFS